MSQESGFGPFSGALPDAPTFGQPEIAQTMPNNPFDAASIPETPNGTVQTQANSFNMTEMAQANTIEQNNGGFNQQSPFNAAPATMPTQTTQSPFNQQPTTQSPFVNNVQPTNVNTFGHQFNNNGFNTNNNNQQKYHIVDMCYLYNQTQNEPPLCIVGFNADFNNLRIGLHNFNNPIDHFVCVKNTTRLTAINLYSEFCYQVLITSNGTIPIIERTFSDNANWAPNRTQIIKNQNMIQIQTIDMNNNQFTFTMNEPNIGLFNKCLEFMINGGAWSEFLRMKV